ncbi:MAG TPA: nucleotide exchange factor GrpE [bacterium]|nr:nucleotide exchange factor GrpE [bacterium]
MNKHKKENDKHDAKAGEAHGNNAHAHEPKADDAHKAGNAHEPQPEKKPAALTAEEIQKLEEKAKKADENYASYLRAVADLDNYRKRAQKDKEEILKYSNSDFIKGLLPILDNFDRALTTINDATDIAKIREGIDLIVGQFHKYLEQLGLARIPTVGEPFDPYKHQAVMHVETEEHPENVVVEELQKGYLLNDRLLRPSMVKVSKGKAAQ